MKFITKLTEKFRMRGLESKLKKLALRAAQIEKNPAKARSRELISLLMLAKEINNDLLNISSKSLGLRKKLALNKCYRANSILVDRSLEILSEAEFVNIRLEEVLK